MKNLQQQFNLIKEGNGDKNFFLKCARNQFPQYINQYSSYDSTVKTLLNKSIISEATKTEQKEENWFKIFEENIKAVNKETTKEVADMATKNFDFKDEKNIDNIYGEAFLKGFYTEMGDPKNKEKTVDELKQIVAKNLAKDRLYYVKDGQFGIKGLGYSNDQPGLGEPKAPKGKYKSSGYGDLPKEKLNENESEKKNITLYKIESLSSKNEIVLTDKTGNKMYIYKSEDPFGEGEKWILYNAEEKKGKLVPTTSHRMSKIKVNILPFKDTLKESSIPRTQPMVITGEYDGEPVEVTGSDLDHVLQTNIGISNSLQDFIKKVTYHLTDTTDQLSPEDEAKLEDYYKSRLNENDDEGNKIKNAINDIVHYRTLPPQIDYTKPYKIKADKAEEFLMSLPDGEKYMEQVNKEVDVYYDEDEYGKSPSYYDSLFEDKSFEVDPTYTHFALRKSDQKIVTGWEYDGVDKEDIKYFSKLDLKDMDLKPSDFTVITINGLKQKGIDPFNWDNWSKDLYENEEQVKKAILPNKKKGVADQISIKSALEKIIQQVWGTKDLEAAKQIVTDFVTNSKINDASKKIMLNNIAAIINKPRLDLYLANALLKFEKMGIRENINKYSDKIYTQVQNLLKNHE